MNGKKLISTSLLAAACMVFDAGLVLAQTNNPGAMVAPGSNGREVIHPNISSPNTSYGGTQSERTSPGGVPLPECSRFSGTTGYVHNQNAVENCNNQSAQNQNNEEHNAQATQANEYSSMNQHQQNQAWENGSTAPEVREAQRALDDKGYNPGPIDGMMGPQTQAALRSFQRSNDLPVTGTLTEQTMDQLGINQNANVNGVSGYNNQR